MESANELSSSNSERNEEEHLDVESAEVVDSTLSTAEVVASLKNVRIL